MEKEAEEVMDKFIMNTLKRVTAFDMFAQAMNFVHAAAEAGGTVDMLNVGPIGGAFESSVAIESVFEDKYLTVFGDIEPWPEGDDEEEKKDVTHNFTLNEKGWKFAEHIKQLCDAMKDIAPTQAQLEQWYKEDYEKRKKEVLAEKKQNEELKQ